MPKVSTTLDHKEVQKACAYWVEQQCPEPQKASVWINITSGSNDPRECPTPTVSATITR